MNLDRKTALDLVKSKVSNKNLVKHMLAVEAVMRSLALRLGEDPDLWGLTGLLHDLDYTTTADKPDRHGYETTDMLREMLPQDALHAILAHPGHVAAESRFDWALLSSDPVTGLIVAAALMHPSKSLQGMDVEFVKNRFREKRFAAGADREQIGRCEVLEIDLDDFLGIALKAMQNISKELGL